MTTHTHTTKEVNWSYPSSPNAIRFGFRNAGCWTVSLSDGGHAPRAVFASADYSAAIAHAEAVPLAWHLGKHPDYYYPEAIAKATGA